MTPVPTSPAQWLDLFALLAIAADLSDFLMDSFQDFLATGNAPALIFGLSGVAMVIVSEVLNADE